MSDAHSRSWGPRRWLLLFAAALLFWLLVGLVDAIWYYLVLAARQAPPPLGDVLAFNLPYWAIAALFTPGVVWLARRARFARGRRARAAAAHIAGALAFSAVHELSFRAVSFPLIGKPMKPGDFADAITKFLAGTLDKGLLFYGAIVGAYYAADGYQRYRERERAAAALELERARLNASLAEARLGALKAQIQPHFLFNALHAVSTLVIRGDARTADRMLSHLSRFLRMTLDAGETPIVPLAVELEFLEAYLCIQKLRVGDRLLVEIDVPGELRTAEVPNLLLQPLVENAVEHGIASDPAAGRIQVRARVCGGILTLEVQDDGVGVGSGQPPDEHIGLGNIRARLAHLYPGRHTFRLHPAAGRGTVATVTIPYRALPPSSVRETDGTDPNAHRR